MRSLFRCVTGGTKGGEMTESFIRTACMIVIAVVLVVALFAGWNV